MLDPRLLRAFVAIAETGSFTQAADRLYMTQSTISQQLSRLEQAVGRELIDRTARPIQPTPSGERLLVHARQVLQVQHEAESLFADPAGSASIRIGVPEDLATTEVAKAFSDFTKGDREIRLDVVTGLSRHLTRRFRADEFDIIIARESSPSSDSYAVFRDDLGWFESADITEPWSSPIPLVTFPPGGLYRDAMFDRIERQKCNWYISFSGSGLHSVLIAVEAGLGLTLLPISTARGRRLRPYAEFGMEAAMVVSVYAREQTPAMRDLLENINAALTEHFGAPADSPEA